MSSTTTQERTPPVLVQMEKTTVPEAAGAGVGLPALHWRVVRGWGDLPAGWDLYASQEAWKAGAWEDAFLAVSPDGEETVTIRSDDLVQLFGPIAVERCTFGLWPAL